MQNLATLINATLNTPFIISEIDGKSVLSYTGVKSGIPECAQGRYILTYVNKDENKNEYAMLWICRDTPKSDSDSPQLMYPLWETYLHDTATTTTTTTALTPNSMDETKDEPKPEPKTKTKSISCIQEGRVTNLAILQSLYQNNCVFPNALNGKLPRQMAFMIDMSTMKPRLGLLNEQFRNSENMKEMIKFLTEQLCTHLSETKEPTRIVSDVNQYVKVLSSLTPIELTKSYETFVRLNKNELAEMREETKESESTESTEKKETIEMKEVTTKSSGVWAPVLAGFQWYRVVPIVAVDKNSVVTIRFCPNGMEDIEICTRSQNIDAVSTAIQECKKKIKSYTSTFAKINRQFIRDKIEILQAKPKYDDKLLKLEIELKSAEFRLGHLEKNPSFSSVYLSRLESVKTEKKAIETQIKEISTDRYRAEYTLTSEQEEAFTMRHDLIRLREKLHLCQVIREQLRDVSLLDDKMKLIRQLMELYDRNRGIQFYKYIVPVSLVQPTFQVSFKPNISVLNSGKMVTDENREDDVYWTYHGVAPR